MKSSAELVVTELSRAVSDVDWERWETLPGLVLKADTIFVVGNGRSGLALRLAAMRFMHLGCEAHVVGETTTPAIGPGDLLLAASGSGSTHGTLHAAETAAKLGATVAAITADPSSQLARAASHVLVVPAAVKTDRSGSLSDQYAGTLFEQMTLILLEATFHALWKDSGQTADQMYKRHGNLE
ncbi:MAG TPA: 6-phospho-3-hexuloisomerase [Trebonia sp.]|nr:6-phospho-3-hexuloisomerase [Trebonia sp.]